MSRLRNALLALAGGEDDDSIQVGPPPRKPPEVKKTALARALELYNGMKDENKKLIEKLQKTTEKLQKTESSLEKAWKRINDIDKQLTKYKVKRGWVYVDGA